jgi:hypothetical protein
VSLIKRCSEKHEISRNVGENTNIICNLLKFVWNFAIFWEVDPRKKNEDLIFSGVHRTDLEIVTDLSRPELSHSTFTISGFFAPPRRVSSLKIWFESKTPFMRWVRVFAPLIPEVALRNWFGSAWVWGRGVGGHFHFAACPKFLNSFLVELFKSF